MQIIKFILRRIKRFSVAIFGTKVDELYWRFRHIFDRSWTDSYLAVSDGDFGNNLLVEKIKKYFPFEKILEFGCASGLNLYFLAKRFPQAEFYGIDISRKAINEGRKYFAKKGVKNVHLNSGNLGALKKINDKSIDLVFTNAVLIYFGKDKIEEAIKEILRISKKAVILFEMHNDSGSSVYNDNWIHDYKKLFARFIPEGKIIISKPPENIWTGDWEKFGHIIQITF